MTRDELQQKDIELLTANFTRLEKAMEAGFEKVNSRLDLMNDHFIRKDLYEERNSNLEKRVAGLEDSNKWLFRTVATLIISIIISGIILIK